MESPKAELLSRIERDRDVLIEFLRGFIRCASPNPPGDTREAAAHIRKLLDRHRIAYRVIAPQETMPNIVATFAGGESGRHLALNGHIDVFPLVTAMAGPRIHGAVLWLTGVSTAVVPVT
jgi:succinyl-diaminopimelate desuccinylase